MMETSAPGSKLRGSKLRQAWWKRLDKVFGGRIHSRTDLLHILREARRHNLLGPDVMRMIEGALQVSEMRVRDIMVPRSQMTVVEQDADLETLLPVVVESGHSRFPVIGDSRDEVVGILLAKDLLAYFLDPSRRFDMREVVRPVLRIPESKRLNILLREFRLNRNHMALVVDEYGGVAGVVTIEDVLEEIVGEIEDETDTEEDRFIRRQGEGAYTVRALTQIEDFNHYFGTRFSDDEFDTIGGLVISGFGHMPRRGETTEIGDFRFEVIKADGRRLHELRVKRREG